MSNSFSSIFTKFIDPLTGISGSKQGACNLLLRGEDPSIASPYDIANDVDRVTNMDLETTINNLSEVSKRTNMPKSCVGDSNNTALTTEPCWGSYTTSNDTYGVNTPCNTSGIIWSFPSKSNTADASPTNMSKNIVLPGTTKKITIGRWHNNSNNWGPSQTGLAPIANINKGSYYTYLLSARNASVGTTGGTPTVATLYINYIETTVGKSNFLKTEGIKSLISYFVKNNNSFTGDYNNALSALQNTHNNLISATQSFLLSIGNGNGTSSVSINAELLVNLQKNYNFSLRNISSTNPVLMFIYNTYMKLMFVDKTNATIPRKARLNSSLVSPPCTDLTDNQNILTCISQRLSNVAQMITSVGAGLRQSTHNYSIAINNLNSLFQVDPNQFLSPSTPCFRATSIAFVMAQGCQITGIQNNQNNPQTSQNSTFPWVKDSTGFCAPYDCSNNQMNSSCACNDDNTYMCPFSVYHNNITPCQGSLKEITLTNNSNKPYADMKLWILVWLNSLVSANGCYQRALGMIYGKCVSLNKENLNLVFWDPNSNKLSFQKDSDNNLFSNN